MNRKFLALAVIAIIFCAFCLPIQALVFDGVPIVTYAVEGGNVYFDASMGAISDCESSVTKAVIPEYIDGIKVCTIGGPANYSAFAGCTELSSVTIPDSVTLIGHSSFSGCTSLTNVTIPDGVTYIGYNAFQNCTSLESITLGVNTQLTTIDDLAFYGCTNLKTIYYCGDDTLWDKIQIGNDNDVLKNAEITHKFGDWITITEPTPNEDGERSRKCEICDITETEKIDKPKPIVNPFDDVKADQWYTDGILWCYHSGYMTGISKTEFGRKFNVTRAMFATILAKIDGNDISMYNEMTFSDVPAGQWYSNAIEWAYQNDYAAGIGEGQFGRKNDVSREQIALFFYTYSTKNGLDVSAEADLSAYADLDRVHAWALDAVEWAVAKALISGTSETTLSPRDPATRAEIALIVKNYIQSVLK